MAIDLSKVYTPHPFQRAVHSSAARYKVLQVGRRGGKSRCGLFELIAVYVRALGVPVTHALIPPFHAWIVAPSYRQARQSWHELLAFLPEEFIAPGGILQDDQMVRLVGTEARPWGLMELKSTDVAQSLQTVGLDFLWVQEAQDVSDEAFERLIPTLRSPERMGCALLEGLPSLHRDHWFQRAHDAAERGKEGWQAFHWTSFDNPLLTAVDRADIEGDKELLPEASWRRQYLAEFSAAAGYFGSLDDCIAGDLLPEPLPGARYVAGLDLGRRVDASVLHVMDAKTRRLVHHRVWGAGQSWILQREGVIDACREWGVERLRVDATGMGGDIFAEELAGAGLPVEPVIISVSTREPMLQALAVSIERQTVSFPPVKSLLRQMRAFQHRRLASGTWRAEAPEGEHDDEVFALSLGLGACDPPHEIALAPRLQSGRYLPTQEEAESGVPRGPGARFVRQRHVEKIRQRQENVRE